MDFESWVKKHELHADIVARLADEYMNDINILKQCTLYDIKELGLNSLQYSELHKAFTELQGMEVKDEFETWATENKIKPDTIHKLKQGGFDDCEKLKLITEDELISLDVRNVQLILLKQAVDSLKDSASGSQVGKRKRSSNTKQFSSERQTKKQRYYSSTQELLTSNPKTIPGSTVDTEFLRYLRNQELKDDTIDKLFFNGFDSKESLRHLQRTDIDGMGLNTLQHRLLMTLSEDIQRGPGIPEAPGNQTYAEAFQKLLTDLNFNETTKSKLKDIGVDNFDGLIFLSQDELDEIDIDSKHRKTIEELQDTDTRVYATSIPGTSRVRQRQTAKSRKSNKAATKHDINKNTAAIACKFKENTSKFEVLKNGITNFFQYITRNGVKKEACRYTVINGMKVMKLPLRTVFEDKKAKLRRCIIGKPDIKQEQKTIMVAGATGAGKSTLIDGICNYIFGTKWTERHRFQLIDLHKDEISNAAKGQIQAQTEWITIYTITSDSTKSNRLPFTLNLIDTPGFGDTRGIKRDKMIADQIRALFTKPGKHGIDSIDAVCFLAKAPDVRLTPTQRYIFDSILSIFGHDIGANIIVMITFADGARAPVLDAINGAKLPHRKAFPFNNSALFAYNGASQRADLHGQNDEIVKFSKMFWEMGEESFKNFFDFLNQLSPKSLTLTREVLDQRRNLQDTLEVLEEKVRLGISIMGNLKKEKAIFKINQNKILDNKDFKYTETEYYTEKINCNPGKNVTHCMVCHNTCHEDCSRRDNDEKALCCVMDRATGHCTCCKQKCHWTDHKNTGYKLVHRSRQVEQTYQNKLKEYQKATGIVAEKLNIIEITEQRYEQHRNDVLGFVKRIQDILQRLRKIALKPDPLSEVEYIEILIQDEIDNHEDGWEVRVQELKDIKSKAQRLEEINANKQILASVK